MLFVYIKLVDLSYKEEVILSLQSVGIQKASYIESKNLERALSDEIRLFTGLFAKDPNDGEQGIITALADSVDQVREMLENLRHAGVSIDDHEILRVNAWPVSVVFDNELGWLEPDV